MEAEEEEVTAAVAVDIAEAAVAIAFSGLKQAAICRDDCLGEQKNSIKLMLHVSLIAAISQNP